MPDMDAQKDAEDGGSNGALIKYTGVPSQNRKDPDPTPAWVTAASYTGVGEDDKLVRPSDGTDVNRR
jgi:hypothetical protein